MVPDHPVYALSTVVPVIAIDVLSIGQGFSPVVVIRGYQDIAKIPSERADQDVRIVQ
jgi:hypothetical protein